MTFGRPIGEFAHGGRRQCGAAGAPGGNDAAEVAPLRQEVRKRDRHLRDCAAAVAGEDRALALRMMAGNLARMDHGGRRLARRRQVHRHRPEAEFFQATAQEEQFARLGVEGARDVGGALHVGRDRELHHPRVTRDFCQRRGGPAGGRQLRTTVRAAFQEAVGRPIRIALDQPIDRGRGAGATAVPARKIANGPRLVMALQPDRGIVETALDGEHASLDRLRRGMFTPVLGLPGSPASAGRPACIPGRRAFDVEAAPDAEQALLQLDVGREVRGRHRARDPAIDHHRDGVGNAQGDAKVLLDQQDRDVPLRHQRSEHRLELFDDDRREPLRRFIHDQQPRIEEQRPRDRQHLLLAAGQLRSAVTLALGQPRKGLVDTLDGPLAPPPAARLVPTARRRCSSTVSDAHTRRPCGT